MTDRPSMIVLPDFKTSLYTSVLESPKKACEWAEIDGGRARQYQILIREFFENNKRSKEHILALNESFEIVDIWTCWQSAINEFPGLLAKIRDSLRKGPILREGEDPEVRSTSNGNNIFDAPRVLRYHSLTMNAQKFPSTLQQAIIYFSVPENCVTFLAQLRWPNGVICPNCEAKEVSYLSTRKVWKCKACKKQFSVKVGTIMEDSPIGLDKWLSAIWIIVSAKNGVSSYEMHRSLGITQKSAWFMLHRIRCAMQTGTFKKLSGEVEVDETFIGGKARNMHKSVRERKIKGRGGSGKTAVMGLLERHGEVRTMVVPNIRRQALQTEVKQHVEQGSHVFSDGLQSYEKLGLDYIHNVINHAEEYVRGNIHTNGIENFWSLLKRSIRGTYVSVEPFHLFRYLDEQTFRFNSRSGKDADRFLLASKSLVGKRLTFNELIGKDLRSCETHH